MEARPKTAPRPPEYFGRDWRGMSWLISRKAPEAIPVPPIPAMTLPTIKAFELGADAQTMEPEENPSATQF